MIGHILKELIQNGQWFTVLSLGDGPPSPTDRIESSMEASADQGQKADEQAPVLECPVRDMISIGFVASDTFRLDNIYISFITYIYIYILSYLYIYIYIYTYFLYIT